MARIFGINLPRFGPRLAVAATDFTARTIRTAHVAAKLPDMRTATAPSLTNYSGTPIPVGTQPPGGGSDVGLRGRSVQSDPLSDWYLAVRGKIPPKQIENILQQALAGNIWQQTQLARLMADTWPTFAKCSFELRAAIASTKYVVHAHAAPGQKPTESSQAKADLVQEALDAFEPDRFADEDGFNGMIFDLTDAIINGVSVTEMLWNDDETNVRASAWVHPRNLAFTADGRLGVANAAESGNMSFSNNVRLTLMNDPDKFLVAKFKSKSGSCLGAGWMRKLTGYWVMIVYGRDFALNFAQKYGNPFFDLAYDSAITNNAEIDKFEHLAEMAANQGWLVHPNNSELKLGAAHGMAGDNAQLALMRLADEQCQYLMLGQTLTSTAPKNGGTRAQGDVHMDVRTERIEEHCKWIGRLLTDQFADSILRVNYGRSYKGSNRERPTIEPDMTRPLTAAEQADFFQKASTTKIPRLADETYKRAGCAQPQPGDLVISDQGITIMEEPMTATDKGQKDFDTQLQQQKDVHSEFGDPDGPDAGGVQAALAKASAADLLELETLVVKAEQAPHRNGEVTAVQMKLKQLVEKSRV